jgi:hypothetical protein
VAFITPTVPNLADFLTFAAGQGVPTADVPTSSDAVYQPQYALDAALDEVAGEDSIGASSAVMRYVMAVYNLALHIWVVQGDDLPGQTFFSNTRTSMKLLEFTGGVVQSSNDETTGNTLAVVEGYKTLPIYALDYHKTPWGIKYLAYATRYGSSVVVMV